MRIEELEEELEYLIWRVQEEREIIKDIKRVRETSLTWKKLFLSLFTPFTILGTLGNLLEYGRFLKENRKILEKYKVKMDRLQSLSLTFYEVIERSKEESPIYFYNAIKSGELKRYLKRGLVSLGRDLKKHYRDLIYTYSELKRDVKRDVDPNKKAYWRVKRYLDTYLDTIKKAYWRVKRYLKRR